MRYRCLLACLILIALPAIAMGQTTVTFGWDAHTQAADITGFKLYQSKQAGTYTSTPIATFVGGTAVTGQIPIPKPGRWYWVLTAYVDQSGTIIESLYSNEVSDVVKPLPPTGVKKVAGLPIAAAQAIGSAVKGIFSGHKNLRILKPK